MHPTELKVWIDIMEFVWLGIGSIGAVMLAGCVSCLIFDRDEVRDE